MRSIYSLLTLALVTATLISTTTASAADYDARVRLQVKNDGASGVSGIAELPNFNSAPGQVMVGAGYGLSGKKYEVGFHLAGLTLAGNPTALVDVRGTVHVTDSLYGWVNVRLLGLEDEDTTRLYGFGMVNCKLPSVLNFLALGIESENSFDSFSDNRKYTKDYSVGPNVHVALSPALRLEASYQVHSEFRNQAWARLNIRL